MPRGGSRGVREGLGLDKSMCFYFFPDLMFSITFVSVMHFHSHLCISIFTEILKEIFAVICSAVLCCTGYLSLVWCM